MSHRAEEEFERNMVPIIPAKSMDLKMIDEFAIVNPENLQREINNWKSILKDKKRKENKKEFLKVIDEYRAQRKRSTPYP
jgi:uncharacterized protein